MRAVRHTLEQGKVPRDALLSLVVDNTSVMHSFARQKSHRYQLNGELRRILPKWVNITARSYSAKRSPSTPDRRGDTDTEGNQIAVVSSTGGVQTEMEARMVQRETYSPSF
jgi:hypothetical protein